MKFKACIFDLDGTLLDSMEVWRNIDVKFLEKRSIPFTEEYGRAISSMKLAEAAEYTVELFGLDENPSDIIDEWMEMAREEFALRVEMKPFAKELLQKLHKRKIPFAVATTSKKELYQPPLERNGVCGLFWAIIDSDTVKCGKDKPDIFLKAAGLMGVKPEECVVFEDTVTGLKTADSCGFFTVGMIDAHGANSPDEIREIADMCATDFERFLSLDLF